MYVPYHSLCPLYYELATHILAKPAPNITTMVVGIVVAYSSSMMTVFIERKGSLILQYFTTLDKIVVVDNNYTPTIFIHQHYMVILV